MRKDAELHAEEDKQKQRLAEVRNRSEALCFQTEKLIKENDEKLSDADKAPLEAAIAKAREAAKGEDADAVQSAHDALEQASHALSKVLYESQAADAAGGETAGSEPAGAAAAADDTIDAEFEVKQDDE
jgi:molecular chaperone DnaK